VNPDVARAVDALGRAGTLSAAQMQLFSRVARGELLSVHGELRLLAYSGVLLVTAGVGVLVQQNLDRIGPLAVALALGVGAASCLAWVARRATPFSPDEVPSTDLAFDYVLLLGALLAGADLAYVEAQFTPLGTAWAWHLLIVSALYAFLAFRYDSRVVLSLALSTFAAWRGVSAGTLEHALWGAPGDASVIRANAFFCGALFITLGEALKRRDFKAHFEPVAAHLGWLLVLAAPLSALDEIPFALGLTFLGAGLAVYGWRARRFSLLALGVLGAYAGVSAVVLHDVRGNAPVYWFAFTALGVLGLLHLAHRRLREPM
jgi:hypothetical protein